MEQSFDPSEKYQSQIPAMQALVNLGFEPLSQQEALKQRDGKLRSVLLEDVLIKQLLEINHFTVKGKNYPFSIEDVHEAVRKLKPSPDQLKGLRGTNQDLYDLMMLGTTISKTINGDTKSHNLRYINWDNPKKNKYHVTAEFSVERTGSTLTRRCDIVAFVNGIPFIVIENKAPAEDLKKADSQLIGYQNEENIPHLFHYAQLLLTMNRGEARYATIGTAAKFWQGWKDEEDKPESIEKLINTPLTLGQKQAVFSGDFADALPYFEEMETQGPRIVSEQDKLIYALCRPDRLLDMVRRFIVFDGGIKKIARHQQFFGIRAAINRIKQFDMTGQRKGGVVWHTQGSGKSLTMVMLARALIFETESIKNPRIIMVTDRVDLARQIRDTFRSCDLEPKEATSGADLLDKLESRINIITTVINKFETALRNKKFVDDDPNVFVLIDESHRSQTGKYGGHGNFAGKMRKILPQACYVGFTGTPLLKREKNDLKHFGGLIHKYTIDEAVKDGAVVPLLYEGRMVEQKITGTIIDDWFEKISEGLTDEQKADLKRKFSRIGKVTGSAQALEAKAFDISEHYRQYWQGTGFKAQLVAPSKAAAIRMKDMLDEIGHITSEVIISQPDDREGNEEVDAPSKDLVRKFWDKIMKRYKDEEDYNREVISAFKSRHDPEILIVVSKLLTGFDAPRNTVLYLCKPLKEHNLLQAIARVNRLFEDEGQEKEFGFIIDYEGLLGELDKALSTYSTFEGYDENDISGALHDVREEIRKLPQLHDQLWDLFKEILNKKDMEAFEQYLHDQLKRDEFYEQLKTYGKCLHISLSSDKALDVFSDKQVSAFKADLKHFSILKKRVQIRYQEIVDVKSYEPKIQKLLDDHLIAGFAQKIIDAVNINDPEALERVVQEQGLSDSSKADRIASATKRTITEKMDENPAFYKRFSELLSETISDYRAHRISEMEYLKKIMDIARSVSKKEHDKSFPEIIEGNEDARAFYGILEPVALEVIENREDLSQTSAEMALKIVEIIQSHLIVNVWKNDVVQNKMRNAIDDYFFDEIKKEKNIDIPLNVLDDLEKRIMALAKARFPR